MSVIALDIASTRSYYFHNGHGDVAQLTDSTGNVTKNYAHGAFGVATTPTVGDVNPFRYALVSITILAVALIT